MAPLVIGVSGALHQSFSTEEEAKRVFEGERAKGNTKVIGIGQSSGSPSNLPQSAPPVRSPTVVSSSQSQTTHSRALASTTSSPRTQSTHRAAEISPLSSYLSPPATGVTYVIELPNITTPLRLTSPRAATQVPRSPEPRTTAHTPSLLNSYPNYASSNSTSSSPATGVTHLLSPLNSPKLQSQGDPSWHESYGRTSNRSLPNSPKHGAIVAPNCNTSSMIGSPRSGRCRCQHTCRHTYSSHVSSAASFGFSQSLHIPSGSYESGDDPRSPMTAKTKVPVAAK